MDIDYFPSSPAPALSWAAMVGDTLEEVADRVTWHPTAYDQVRLNPMK